MPDLLLAPYLPATEATQVGPWRLLPFGQLEGSDEVAPDLQRAVSRLVDAYRVPQSGGSILGAVIYPSGTHVGASFERTAMRPLGHALLAGTVADNPLMAVPEEEQSPNAGHGTATSENALLYGHPLGGESYAIEVGVLVRSTDLRHTPEDEPLPKVEPPVELPTPFLSSFDHELADATHGALCSGAVEARRLGRALDWYRIALSNAEAVTLDVRVGAARSGLEALTGASEETRQLVRAYGKLTRETDSQEQTYEDVFWAKGAVQLTDDEWWMTRLCALRNAIVHDEEVPDNLLLHDGQHQLNHIHDRLIAVLKRVVSELADDPLLRLSRSDRVFDGAGTR